MKERLDNPSEEIQGIIKSQSIWLNSELKLLHAKYAQYLGFRSKCCNAKTRHNGYHEECVKCKGRVR